MTFSDCGRGYEELRSSAVMMMGWRCGGGSGVGGGVTIRSGEDGGKGRGDVVMVVALVVALRFEVERMGEMGGGDRVAVASRIIAETTEWSLR